MKLMLMQAPRTWYFAGALYITSTSPTMLLGTLFSTCVSCSWLRFVTCPSMITVTARPPRVRLPSVSTTPGSAFKASYALSVVVFPGNRLTSYTNAPPLTFTTGRSPLTITSGNVRTILSSLSESSAAVCAFIVRQTDSKRNETSIFLIVVCVLVYGDKGIKTP